MRTIEWAEGKVRFLDQAKLPLEEQYIVTDDELVVAQAIRTLAIRGAPLIGIAAAYGFALALQRATESPDQQRSSLIERAYDTFAGTRPTAVNLFWALERIRAAAYHAITKPRQEFLASVLLEALSLHREDEAMCKAISELGSTLIPPAATILTHCNTGSLATGGQGTALGIIVSGWEQHKLKHVYIDETRPLFQGARLTAWELKKLEIPCTLITDTTAAFLMQRRVITAIIVGADRITLNGDVANKVGTYGLAVLAQYHNIPLYVAAPTSTIDFEMMDGKQIPIEQRSGREVTHVKDIQLAPDGVEVYSPAFDITPGELITAIVTEKGILHAPYRTAIENIKKMQERDTDVRTAGTSE
ncbi:MAG: S-methyl-5-thioribose-1-phosphate isomerase [bacterium]